MKNIRNFIITTIIYCGFSQTINVQQALAQEVTLNSYDALGRLQSVTHSSGPLAGTQASYSMDNADSRSSYNSTLKSVISVANVSVNEGATLNLTLNRTGDTSTTVSISYSTSDGFFKNFVAKSGVNYTSSSGVVTFSAGSNIQTISIQSIDDHIKSLNSYFTINLSSTSSNVVISIPSVQATVVNID